jgi:ABC-type glycerol-3-phosphate transport system substrate-binding protein
MRTTGLDQSSKRLAFLLVAILAAACAPSGPGPTTAEIPSAPAESEPASAAASPAPPATGKVTIWSWTTAMATYPDESGENTFAELVKQDLGIDLEVTLVEQPDLGPKLRAALPAGTGPDLVMTDFDVMNPYWTFTEPLDSLAERTWGADWRAKFTDASTSEMEVVATFAGKPGQALYLPGNMQLLGWPIYSRSSFDAAGVDAAAITTYDAFIEACQILETSGTTPLAMGSHPAGLVDLFQVLVEVAAPGRMELAQHGQARFTDADLAKTFDLIAEVFSECAQEGAIGADIQQGAFDPFFRGEMAMAMQFTGTPWFGFLASPDAATVTKMHEDVGTFPFPESKGLSATDAGIAMIAGSQNKEAAWRVIEWIVAGAGAERKAVSEPMAWIGYEREPTNTPFDDNVATPLLEAMVSGDNKFRRILCADVYNALGTVIPGVVTGQIGADEAAQEVQTAFDRGCQAWVS